MLHLRKLRSWWRVSAALFLEMGSILWSGFGAPFILVLVPTGLFTLLHPSGSKLKGFVVSVWGDLDYNKFLWGVFLLVVYLLVAAHKRIKKRLDDFIGSRDIHWAIEEILGAAVNYTFFFSGSIYNGDASVMDATVHLIDFKGATPQDAMYDMELRRRGGGESRFDLHNGQKLVFDIAMCVEKPNSMLHFIGHIEDNDMKQAVGPGIHEFTLRLFGKDFKSRNCRVRMEYVAGGGPNCVKVLEAVQDKYPSLDEKFGSALAAILATLVIAGALWALKLQSNLNESNVPNPLHPPKYELVGKKEGATMGVPDVSKRRLTEKERIIKLGESLRKLSLENGSSAPYPKKASDEFNGQSKVIFDAINFIRIHGRLTPYQVQDLQEQCAAGAIDTCGYGLKEGALSIP